MSSRLLALPAALLLAALTSTAAYAVQTDDFGLAASGHRSSIKVAPGVGAVRDSLTVYNRTSRPLVIDFDVVEAVRQPDGTLNFGAPGKGLAADIHLGQRSMTLAPRATRSLTVTVDRPRTVDNDRYAAVTAVEQPGTANGVAVTERLAVFVGVVASGGETGPLAGPSSSADGSRTGLLAGAAAAIVALGLMLLVAARRRREQED